MANERPQGSSSVVNSGGHDSYLDKNSNLTYRKAHGRLSEIGEWEKMLKTNPIARVAYTSLIATLQSAAYDVEYPRHAEEGQRNADVLAYVKRLLFIKPRKRFSEYVETLLQSVGHGFYPHELTVAVGGDGFLYLEDASPRPPRTFDPSTIKRLPSGWVQATQTWLDADDKMQTAKYGDPGTGAGWLWWPVYGSGLFGDPILRPVWNEHCEKEDIRKIRRLAIQKSLLPTPMLKLNPDLDQSEDGRADEIKATQEQLGKTLYHEEAVGVIPGWVDEVIPWEPGKGSIESSIEAENHCDLQMLLAFNAQWMGRGLLAPYGSAASSTVDTQEQRNVRKHYVDWVRNQWQVVIDYFVEWNFGPQEVYPELSVIYKEELNLQDEVNSASRLLYSGGLWVDQALRDHFRNIFGWPTEGADAVSPPKLIPELSPQWSPVKPDDRTPEQRKQEEAFVAEVRSLGGLQ